MDETMVRSAVADFDRWHAGEMGRITGRGRRLWVAIFGVGLLLPMLGVAAWVFR